MEPLWMIRGVGKQARKLARVGCAMSGMTMGAWLSLVIEHGVAEMQRFNAAKEEIKKSEEAGVGVPGLNEERIAGGADHVELVPGAMDFDDLVDEGKPAPELDEVKQTVDPTVSRAKKQGPAIQKKAKADVKARAEKNSRKCAHGMKAGFNCWQCGGIAR